ncbi:MAG: 1-acyl-sn-glycerol-3-phosphate acyltransferase [Myxococcaceae bacterium]|nr:1-acyl-sn-glycerol-3-phosphate acyltransferase [Myxococcaceae bacterium]
MPSPGELSLHWPPLERTGPRPSAILNLLRAAGAISLLIAFVGSSLVRLWLGARSEAIFTGPIRLYAKLTLRLLGVRLEIEGLEKLDRLGGYLLMANHGSLLDVFLFGALCARPTLFVVKKELGRIPLLGRLLRRCGHVLLDRAHPVRAMRELNRTTQTLKSGGRALIFPEGTRHPDGVLGPFRSGAFVVAARARVPLIPIAVLGAAACCPKNPLAFRPGLVRLVILDPIDTTAWSDDTPDAHSATVREALAAPIAAYRDAVTRTATTAAPVPEQAEAPEEGGAPRPASPPAHPPSPPTPSAPADSGPERTPAAPHTARTLRSFLAARWRTRAPLA